MSDPEDFLERNAPKMDAVLRRMADRNVEHNRRVLESQTDLISDRACLCWAKDDLRFFLCESPVWRDFENMRQNPALRDKITLLGQFGRYNGYVRFPKLPLVAPGIKGIITYVPVHGGITFFQEWWDGSVTYGFDTGHAVSMENTEIINSIDWMMMETESLGRGIKIAARFEPHYLNARTNERKAVVLERMGKFLPLDIGGNFEVMLNLLAGEL